MRKRRHTDRSITVQARYSSRIDAEGCVALQGLLGAVALTTVLAIFEMERRSGVIATSRRAPRRETGEIWLRDGRIVHVHLDSGPGFRGRAALYYLLNWREGRFAFSAMTIESEDEFHSSTTHLLLEAARCRDKNGEAWSDSTAPQWRAAG